MWLWGKLNLHLESIFCVWFIWVAVELSPGCPDDRAHCMPPKISSKPGAGESCTGICRSQLLSLWWLMLCSQVAHPRIHSPSLRSHNPQLMECTGSSHCIDPIPDTATRGKILPCLPQPHGNPSLETTIKLQKYSLPATYSP